MAVDAVMGGQVDNAFCAVRPPGHHAERNRAMGFCFFNNVAIGAVYALEKYGLKRVAIIDWDVHHGNGTEHLFEEDPRVFFVSLHGDPRYCSPGTGYRQEEGKGAGKGFTLNLPLPIRSGDSEYLEVLRSEALPRLRQFAAQHYQGVRFHRPAVHHQNLLWKKESRQSQKKCGYGQSNRAPAKNNNGIGAS